MASSSPPSESDDCLKSLRLDTTDDASLERSLLIAYDACLAEPWSERNRRPSR